VRALVLADTHLRPDRARRLPNAVFEELARCDVVLHAGDVVTRDLLDELRRHAPVHAVLGNNDRTLRGDLPERLELQLAGVAVALVHETGATQGRAARVRRWFPAAQVVVFGHSHQPFNEWHDDQLLFNPGSPTERRRAPHHTYGVLELAAGCVTMHDIVTISSAE
jgi:putative phosphoesterase